MSETTNDNEQCLCVGGPLPAGDAFRAIGVAVGFTCRSSHFTNVPSITASHERKSLTRQTAEGSETREFFVFDGERDAKGNVLRGGLSDEAALALTEDRPALYWEVASTATEHDAAGN
ncbi:hypothetical protein CFB40_21090 [Burkholderia sp. AU31652]|uniref:hypothetical protein n=1 Tax=Burkholderia sp. AU31652 TaxID=2015354 RepID=UPI000B92450A|nr:hypothetical protein [Burkholderia sp. AU31652]OXI83587.1 hypothetical protein CFB40_21090 [Burkholderia sp. AU31652]